MALTKILRILCNAGLRIVKKVPTRRSLSITVENFDGDNICIFCGAICFTNGQACNLKSLRAKDAQVSALDLVQIYSVQVSGSGWFHLAIPKIVSSPVNLWRAWIALGCSCSKGL